ncbi:MAG TPA: condensation domain-containing protein [Candidatus Sulfotelmatobacter sp.]|nr:condensation domain-containing protein [Candidatus Sulfotelmatobacter sp.]
MHSAPISEDPAPASPPQSFHIYPASLAQRRLWFLDQLQAPTSAYNVYVDLWLHGVLDVTILQSSIEEIVRRHETLRTTFAFENGELFQRVAPPFPLGLPVTDFAHFSDPYPPAFELAKREAETPFDLSAGPLFRSRLMRIKANEHVLLCTMHHTITDAWSLQTFTKELASLYKALSTGTKAELPDLAIQYGDFSEWQHQMLRTEKAQKQLLYWKTALEGAPPILELPQDNPRPAEQTLQGSSQTYSVPSEVMSAVLALAAQYQVTPFMYLLAAFKVFLYRLSGQPDVLVGVPAAGRSEVETEALIGLFVETVVLRDDLSGNPRFLNLLPRVRQTTLDALANADIPFEKVVATLSLERDLSCNPIFQVMFSVIQSAIRSHSFGELSVFPYIVNSSTSILDLFATFVEDSDHRWFLQIDFNTALFRVERIARMVDDFISLLRQITRNPEIHIDDIRLSCAPPLAIGAIQPTKNGRGIQPSNRTRLPGNAAQQSPASQAQTEQELLTEIWKDVLGLKQISVRENFFDLGGHSLMAAHLTDRIKEVTGRTIPVSTIFRAPTIESLAAFLSDNPSSKPDPMLMQLRHGKSEVPLFAIAAPGVESLGYALLAHHLGEDDRIYKLQGPGPVVQGRPFDMEEIQGWAKEYVNAIRTVQSAGPFCFAAMCDGVLIAQEMILQLESAGEEVGFFAIFDTWVLENSQIPALWAIDYYVDRMRRIRQLPVRQQFATMQRVLKRLVGQKRPRTPWGQAYWPGENFVEPTFRAPVLLFKRPRQPYFYVSDPEMGWSARSRGGVEVCEVHCGHYDFLRQPHVSIVAQKLSARIRKIGEKSRTTTLPYPEIHLEPAVASEIVNPQFQ